MAVSSSCLLCATSLGFSLTGLFSVVTVGETEFAEFDKETFGDWCNRLDVLLDAEPTSLGHRTLFVI